MTATAQIATVSHNEIVVTEIHGELDIDETLAILAQVFSSDRLANSYDLLFDLRGIHCELSTADIFSIINHLYQNPRTIQCKIALLLATSTDLIKENLLKSCMARRGVEIALFFDQQNALTWLSESSPKSH